MNRGVSRHGGWLLVVAYLGFIGLGMPDGLLGVAWPSIRDEFGLAHAWLGSVLLASGLGYALASFNAGWLIQRLGVGGLLAASSGLMVLALAGFATSPHWWLFVAWGFAAGAGGGAIDAGLNLYAANQFSARHMNWLHACWGIGVMLGPLAVTEVLRQSLSWRWAYVLLGCVLLALAVVFLLTLRAWHTPESTSEGGTTALGALRQPLVLLQILLYFIYTGIETVAGQWSYSLFTEGRGMDPVTAGYWVAGYWAALTAGRFGFGLAVERLDPDRLLRLAMMGALLGAVLVALGRGWLAGGGLVLLGMMLAPVFPILMSRTPARLGNHLAVHAVGFQVTAAMIGAVVIPTVTGLLVSVFGLVVVSWVTVVSAVLLLVGHERLLLSTTGGLDVDAGRYRLGDKPITPAEEESS